MKKIFLALALIASGALLMPAIASQPENSKTEITETKTITAQDIENFFTEWQNSLTSGDYEHAIAMIDLYMADDFAHYDDGEKTYGKEGYVNMMKGFLKDGKITDLNIKVHQIVQEGNIITANIDVKQKFFERSPETGELIENTEKRMHLNCTDSLRVLDDERFELFKCSCNILDSGVTAQ